MADPLCSLYLIESKKFASPSMIPTFPQLSSFSPPLNARPSYELQDFSAFVDKIERLAKARQNSPLVASGEVEEEKSFGERGFAPNNSEVRSDGQAPESDQFQKLGNCIAGGKLSSLYNSGSLVKLSSADSKDSNINYLNGTE